MNQTDKGTGRNAPCPCGSGRKYKQCCLDKDEATARKAREKAAKAAEKAAAKAAKAKPKKEPETQKGEEKHSEAPHDGRSGPHHPRPQSEQPWKRSAANAHPVQRKSLPRKVGGK